MRKTLKMLVATVMVSGLLLGPVMLKDPKAVSIVGRSGRAAPCGWAPGRSGT